MAKRRTFINDDREELDLVHRDRELVLDLVHLERVIAGVLAEAEHAAVGQQLLKSQARLEAFADGLCARQQQNHQVIGARAPDFAGAQPKVPVPGFGQGGAPEPAEGIARRPARSIGEDREIHADFVAQRLDVQPEGLECVHHAARPGAGHSQARMGPGVFR